MRTRWLCAVSVAAVVAAGVAVGVPAQASSGCASGDPKWTYSTSTMTAAVSVPMKCYPHMTSVVVAVQIERCDTFGCTHSPKARRRCDLTAATCSVRTHLDHGPVESKIYYLDASVDASSRTRGVGTASRTVLTCTSAAVTATC